MKGAKQILLAGFAALCMVLPACHTAIPGEEFARRTPLVISSEPLNTVSYTAEYTQDGALPFTCEVKLGTDGRIRRDYVWKDEKGAEKKASVVINGTEAIKSEDGKSVPAKDTDKAMAKLYSRLILNKHPVPSVSGLWSLRMFPAPSRRRCCRRCRRENISWQSTRKQIAGSFSMSA